MATQPSNPAAFPQPQFDEFGHAKDVEKSGMTLRDWFAGQALSRLVSGDGPQLPTWAHLAAASYDAADAMLVARATPTQVEKGGAE